MAEFASHIITLIDALSETEKKDIEKQAHFCADMLFDTSFNQLKENTFYYTFKMCLDYYLQKGQNNIVQAQVFYQEFEKRVVENIDLNKPNPLNFSYIKSIHPNSSFDLHEDCSLSIMTGISTLLTHTIIDYSDEKKRIESTFQKVMLINERLDVMEGFFPVRTKFYADIVSKIYFWRNEKGYEQHKNILDKFLHLIQEYQCFEDILLPNSNNSEIKAKDKTENDNNKLIHLPSKIKKL